MECYTSVSKNSTADRKAVKVLLNNKMATVRIDAKVESFVSAVAHPRQPNKRERERGVDKTHRVTDRIPFKRANQFTWYTLLGSFKLAPPLSFR
jgi:hypothetical protein